jgi:hypothetical protein
MQHVIKRSPTPKLYFGKFTECVRFGIHIKSSSIRHNPSVRAVKDLLVASGVRHRTRLDWHFGKDREVIATLNCYFNGSAVTDQLLASQHGSLITEIVAPANDHHRDLLLSGVEIELRPKLIYGKFRYKVQFRTGRNRENLPMIREWIGNQFTGKPGSKGQYLLRGSWLLALYIIRDEDLMLVRLGLSEHIYSILRVDTLAEHGMQPT